MTHRFWQGMGTLVTLVIAAGMVGTWAGGELRDREIVLRDLQVVAGMSREMSTVCIGRFLIDMPQEARLGLQGLRVDGFEIESFEESAADFLLRAALREKRLKAEPKQPDGSDHLESVREVKTDNGVVGKIFVHGRTPKKGTPLSNLAPVGDGDGNVAIEAMVHGGGMSFEIGAEAYDRRLIENLSKLTAKLVPNRENTVPTGSGFCFDGGWFQDLTADQGEQVIMHGGFPNHPDMNLMLILAAGNKPAEQSLLQRDADVRAKMSLSERLRVSNLRAKPRMIDGLSGDELVTRVHEYNDATVFGFWWEVNGTEDDVFTPHLSLSMDTGKGNHVPVPSSLSQEGGLALWDKILSSIRYHHPRAGQDAPSVSQPPVVKGNARTGT